MNPSRRRRREIDILSPDDVRAMMNACSRRAPTGVRHRALVALLYCSGLRISEALDLRQIDLDLDELTVTIQTAKNGRRGVSALLPDAVDAIQRWLDVRRRYGVTGRDPLFCTLGRGAAGPHPTTPGGRLSREYVARVIKRLARRIGLAKRVHAHAFRHSHADLLRRRGFDVEEIRRQLRHRSLEVTGRYLDHLGPGDLPSRIREVGPVLEPQKDPRVALGDFLAKLDEAGAERMLDLLRKAVS